METAMNTSRGGMKQTDEKHQGVRPGSSATRKERHQVEKRKPVIDEKRERNASRRSRLAANFVAGQQPSKRRKGSGCEETS
jgi:hypothetical protein